MKINTYQIKLEHELKLCMLLLWDKNRHIKFWLRRR